MQTDLTPLFGKSAPEELNRRLAAWMIVDGDHVKSHRASPTDPATLEIPSGGPDEVSSLPVRDGLKRGSVPFRGLRSNFNHAERVPFPSDNVQLPDWKADIDGFDLIPLSTQVRTGQPLARPAPLLTDGLSGS